MIPSTSESCPMCNGETDPRKLLLLTLCDHHFAEIGAPSEESFRKAIEEGMRDAESASGRPPVSPQRKDTK